MENQGAEPIANFVANSRLWILYHVKLNFTSTEISFFKKEKSKEIGTHMCITPHGQDK